MQPLLLLPLLAVLGMLVACAPDELAREEMLKRTVICPTDEDEECDEPVGFLPIRQRKKCES